jgi:UDP-N-acetylmuramoyl-tripeptide--D-alanyl-D-alanine ligase
MGFFMGKEKLFDIFKKSNGVTIDTREDVRNKIFFALKGESFDGNKYAEKAIEKGAIAVVVDNSIYYKKEDDRCCFVKDVLTELQLLSHKYRKTLSIPFIAITGTNGKTTTKELVASVLSKKHQTAATKGNFNNHIGLPLTLLSIKKEDEIAIVEMGANHRGEIHDLCELAEPDYGLITNIGKAHLEGFGSVENIIQTKTELYRFVEKNNGKIFLNKDDVLLVNLSKGIETYTYGENNTSANISAKVVSCNPFLSIQWQSQQINTKLIGEYNKYNVLAAISIGEYFNVGKNKIIEAIENYTPTNNRSQLIQTEKNKIILDAYNANPSSMLLAIKNFLQIKAEKKMLVLGDMFELGEDAEKEHSQIIKKVEELGFVNLVIIGECFNSINESNYKSFKTTIEAKEYFEEKALNGYTILIKASRGMQLETLKDVF